MFTHILLSDVVMSFLFDVGSGVDGDFLFYFFIIHLFIHTKPCACVDDNVPPRYW